MADKKRLGKPSGRRPLIPPETPVAEQPTPMEVEVDPEPELPPAVIAAAPPPPVQVVAPAPEEKYVVATTIKTRLGGREVTLRAGKPISSSQYSIATLRELGVNLTPA